ncbi:MAG: J domain-containing protein [Rhodocyclaceae bacterium]|nr:J domain-containing protein [Rhodocyclaceae bacterium]
MFATMNQEHYRELGVPRQASHDEIKAAFRRMAMHWHPDRNKAGNAEEVFKRIKSAYEVLSDSERRRAYDAESQPSRTPHSHSSRQAQYQSQYHYGQTPPRPEHQDWTSRDPWADAEYQPPPARKPEPMRKKGRELRRIIEIPLEIAAMGGTHVVAMYMGHVCHTCEGEGDVPASTCLSCFGGGRIRQPFGHWHACPDCKGTGKSHKLCPDCLGTGLAQRMRTLKVSIPAGIVEGTVIRLREAGTESRSHGPRGDILFTIKLAPHRRYRVERRDLRAELQVDFVTAWIGGKLRVRTLHGRVDLSIPPLRQGARTLRLKGLGLTDLRSGSPGDLLVRVSDGRPEVAGYLPAP